MNERIGLDWKSFRYQTWAGPEPEMPLSLCSYTKWRTTPETYGFYFGAKFGRQPGIWMRDIWNNLDAAPFRVSIRGGLLRWKGKPRHETSIDYVGDEKSRRLDSMTAEDSLVEDYGVMGKWHPSAGATDLRLEVHFGSGRRDGRTARISNSLPGSFVLSGGRRPNTENGSVR